MVRNILCSIAMLLAQGLTARAEDWTFHYGPDFGQPPAASYATVSASRNTMLVHAYGDSGNIAVQFHIDTFEHRQAIDGSLKTGADLTLDVFGTDPRYKRVVPRDHYVWEERPDEERAHVLFLLTADDWHAMQEAKAVFLWLGSVQLRFGMVGADTALGNLLSALQDGTN